MKVVILAAGTGSRLRPYTDELPKALVPMNGRPLLAHMLDTLAAFPVEELVVITGFRAERLHEFFATRPENPTFIFNERFDTAGNAYSLLCAEPAVLGSDFVKLDADLVFEPSVIRRLIDAPGDVRLMADVHPCGAEEMKIQVDAAGRIVNLSKLIDPAAAYGESIGMEYCTVAGGRRLFPELAAMMAEKLDQEYYEEAYGRLARAGAFVTATEVGKDQKWFEIDTIEDLRAAEALFSR
jgi:choline kinase